MDQELMISLNFAALLMRIYLMGTVCLIHKPPASIGFVPIKHALAVTVAPFKFSPVEPVAY